jgi:hypothetical protein
VQGANFEHLRVLEILVPLGARATFFANGQKLLDKSSAALRMNQGEWVQDCIAGLSEIDRGVVVLHDIPGACLARLPEFMTRIEERGISIVQEFLDSVVVTRNGRFVTLSHAIVADAVPE